MLTAVSNEKESEMEATTKGRPKQAPKPVVEMGVRIAFLEAAVTVLVRDLIARGIAPPTFEDHVIGEAEQMMDVRLAPEKGRGELVAAFMDGEDK